MLMSRSRKMVVDLCCTSFMFLLLLITSFFFNKSEGRAELINHILVVFSLAALGSLLIKILICKITPGGLEKGGIFIVFIALNAIAIATSILISRPYIKDMSAEPESMILSVSECSFFRKYKYKTTEYYISKKNSDIEFEISSSHYFKFTEGNLSGYSEFKIEYYPSSKITYSIAPQ